MSQKCKACILDSARRSAAKFTKDGALRAEIVSRATEAVSRFDMSRPPPELGGQLNDIIAAVLGDPDPYLPDKRRFNQMAADYLPTLRRMVAASMDPFEAVVRLVGAANFIDFGAPGGRVDGDLGSLFADALDRPIGGEGPGAVTLLETCVKDARRVLYIADNAGEIVVDRLLVERFPPGTVTVAVRSGPAINDALIEDARFAGLPEVAQVIESGAAMPGTPWEKTSEAFRELFLAADLIISKGQGNYETLCRQRDGIFFILTAKCRVVAEQIGCQVGDFVVATR